MLTVGNSECSSDHSFAFQSITHTCSAALQSSQTSCTWSADYISLSLPILCARLFFSVMRDPPCLFVINAPRRLPSNKTALCPIEFLFSCGCSVFCCLTLLSEFLFQKFTCLLSLCGILTPHLSCECLCFLVGSIKGTNTCPSTNSEPILSGF